MSDSGRSAIPTDNPSSIQKPIPSSVVRMISDATRSAPRPAGTATRALVNARVRRPHAGREAYVAIRLSLPAAGAADGPLAVAGVHREAGVAGQMRVGRGDRRARRGGVDLDLVLVQVQVPGDDLRLEVARVDGAAGLHPALAAGSPDRARQIGVEVRFLGHFLCRDIELVEVLADRSVRPGGDQ